MHVLCPMLLIFHEKMSQKKCTIVKQIKCITRHQTHKMHFCLIFYITTFIVINNRYHMAMTTYPCESTINKEKINNNAASCFEIGTSSNLAKQNLLLKFRRSPQVRFVFFDRNWNNFYYFIQIPITTYFCFLWSIKLTI